MVLGRRVVKKENLQRLISQNSVWSVKMVSYTDSSSEEEKDLNVNLNFHEPIDLAVNQFSVFKIEF